MLSLSLTNSTIQTATSFSFLFYFRFSASNDKRKIFFFHTNSLIKNNNFFNRKIWCLPHLSQGFSGITFLKSELLVNLKVITSVVF